MADYVLDHGLEGEGARLALTRTIVELRGSLVESGHLDDERIEAFLEHCTDPSWWTQAIAFTAVQGFALGE